MTVMLKVLADAPGLVVGAALWLMLWALLPAALAWPTIAAGCVVLTALATGRLEGRTVRLVARARTLSEAEAAVLAPALTRLCSRGVGPPRIAVYIRRAPRPDSVAEPIGRGCLVVSRGLVEAVSCGRLDVDESAAVLIHAVGRLRHGHTRLDLAVLCCAAPWKLVAVVCRRVGGAVRGVPFLALAWRLRVGVAAIAVVQSFDAGRIATAFVVAVFGAATYAVPWCRRAWEARVERAADAFVAAHGFGEALSRLLQRQAPGAQSLERIHRLHTTTASPPLAVVGS